MLFQIHIQHHKSWTLTINSKHTMTNRTTMAVQYILISSVIMSSHSSERSRLTVRPHSRTPAFIVLPECVCACICVYAQPPTLATASINDDLLLLSHHHSSGSSGCRDPPAAPTHSGKKPLSDFKWTTRPPHR